MYPAGAELRVWVWAPFALCWQPAGTAASLHPALTEKDLPAGFIPDRATEDANAFYVCFVSVHEVMLVGDI